MFLHSGASLHGHEYSNKPLPHQQLPPGHRRSPMLKPSFASPAAASVPVTHNAISPATSEAPSPPSVVRSSTISFDSRNRPLRPKPHLRRNSDGAADGDRTPEPVVRFQDPVVAELPLADQAPTPSKIRTPSVLRDSMSEDESSYSASESSVANGRESRSGGVARRSRRRRAPRTSVNFLICHPAPKLSTKKHLLKRIRPTLLMQLQLVSPNCRPLPVVDVYPSSLIAGKVAAPRFSKHFPRLFGINSELGLHDTILVRSENYDAQTSGSESDAEDDFDHRTLLAVLSPLRREKRSEIVLADGSVWVASSLPNGSFDFVHVDEHRRTTTARWVRRNAASTLAPTASGENATTGENRYKYTFSIIDPLSRRHPILATLTESTLSVLDSYTTVSPTAASRYPPSWSRTHSHVPAGPSNETSDSGKRDSVETANPHAFPTLSSPASKVRTTLPVDATLKDFISISAIWVTLEVGWAKWHTTPTCAPSSGPTHAVSGVMRAVSLNRGQLSDKLASDASYSSDTMDCRGRGISPTSRCLSAVSPAPERQNREKSPSVPPRAMLHTPFFPRKVSSTGAAYVQRRKQLRGQMSDTSDSERSSFHIHNRRSHTFSRLSGDFTPQTRSLSLLQSPAPSEATLTTEARWPGVSPSSSVRHQAAKSSTIPDLRQVTTPSLPRGGRSVSAYYATNPLPLASGLDPTLTDFDVHGPVQLEQDEVVPVTNNGPGWNQHPSTVAARGGTARWKRLGNWFKRISGH